MIPTRDPDPKRIEATDLDTGRPLDAEVLTEAEARELRRRKRRAERSQHEQGLRILNTALRQLGRGKLDRAGATVMQGFGKMLLDAAFGKK